jgi:hypothetical protein
MISKSQRSSGEMSVTCSPSAKPVPTFVAVDRPCNSYTVLCRHEFFTVRALVLPGAGLVCIALVCRCGLLQGTYHKIEQFAPSGAKSNRGGEFPKAQIG